MQPRNTQRMRCAAATVSSREGRRYLVYAPQTMRLWAIVEPGCARVVLADSSVTLEPGSSWQWRAGYMFAERQIFHVEE